MVGIFLGTEWPVLLGDLLTELLPFVGVLLSFRFVLLSVFDATGIRE